MTKERTHVSAAGKRPSRALHILAAAIMVSVAFICIIGDGSGAETADYQKSVFAKADNLTMEQYETLESSDYAIGDFMVLTSIFNGDLLSEEHSAVVSDAENICCEGAESKTRSGTSQTVMSVSKLSAKNVELTRTVTEVPNPVYSTLGTGIGFGKIVEYLGKEPLIAGTVIRCTCPEYTFNTIASTKFVYTQNDSGYILSEITEVHGRAIHAVFSYTIGVGSTAKTFDIIFDERAYRDTTCSYSYLSDNPSYGDMFRQNIKANKIVYDFKMNVRINGEEYSLSDSSDSVSEEKTATAGNGRWGYYDSSMHKDGMDDVPDDLLLKEIFDNLSEDNDVAAATIAELGGKSSINVAADAERSADSVRDSICGGSDRTAIYAAAAVSAVAAVLILALLFWKPGFLRKGAVTRMKKDDISSEDVSDSKEAKE